MALLAIETSVSDASESSAPLQRKDPLLEEAVADDRQHFGDAPRRLPRVVEMVQVMQRAGEFTALADEQGQDEDAECRVPRA